jgi:hypothetical protein
LGFFIFSALYLLSPKTEACVEELRAFYLEEVELPPKFHRFVERFFTQQRLQDPQVLEIKRQIEARLEQTAVRYEVDLPGVLYANGSFTRNNERLIVYFTNLLFYNDETGERHQWGDEIEKRLHWNKSKALGNFLVALFWIAFEKATEPHADTKILRFRARGVQHPMALHLLVERYAFKEVRIPVPDSEEPEIEYSYTLNIKPSHSSQSE